MANPVPAAEPVSFFVPYGKLLDAFTWAKKVVRARATMPTLTCALLSFDHDGRLLVQATDLEQSVVTVIDDAKAPPDGGQRALLPVVATLEALKALGSARSSWDRNRHEVQITVYPDTIALSVFGLRSQLEAGPPVEDFPNLPDWHAPSVELVRVPVIWWRAAIAFTAVARGRDDTLPMLTGVRMTVDGDWVEFASTDRYRLAISKSNARPRPSGMAYPKQTLLLPGAMVALTNKLGDSSTWAAHDDVLRLRLFKTGFLLVRDNTHLVLTRLLDATFPAYHSLIPDPGNQTHWTVSRTHLLAAVKAAAAGQDRNEPVKVRFHGGQVSVGTCDPIATSETPAKDWTTAFNPGYLAQALIAFKDASAVTLSGTAAVKPWLVTAKIAGAYSGVTGVHLLMPVRLPQASATA